MKTHPIGILDSGVGGLSILREITKRLPHESIIYLADSKNCPYGDRASKEIYDLSKKMVKLLLRKRVKLIVIACNTITVSCLDKLRRDFPKVPIVGTVPVVKTASKLSKNGRIGILSTDKTSESKYQKNLIEKFTDGLRVLNLGTDKLVPLVENGSVSGSETNEVLKQELKPFLDFQADTLALGCSHFPFLKNQIRKTLGKNIRILDSGGAIARQVERILGNNDSLADYKKPVHLFYTTGNSGQFSKTAKKLLGKKYVKMVKSAKGIIL